MHCSLHSNPVSVCPFRRMHLLQCFILLDQRCYQATVDSPPKAQYVYRILIVMTVRTETESVARGSGIGEVLQELPVGNGRRGFPLKRLRGPFHVRCLLHIRPSMTPLSSICNIFNHLKHYVIQKYFFSLTENTLYITNMGC